MYLPAFRLLRSDIGVFLYYAGRDRRHMDVARQEKKVFLELPGFAAVDGTFEREGEVIQRLHMSSAIAKSLNWPDTPRPSRQLTDYPVDLPQRDGRPDRSFLSEIGNIGRLFKDAKVGDLVIMTPSNHYDPLLIGEIESDWHPDDDLALEFYGGEKVPARRVKWLSTGLSRRDFPAAVARRLQNRKAITLFDQTHYDQIFKLVYGAYIWGNTSKLSLYAPEFYSNDPTDPLASSFIIKYGLAAYSAYIQGEIETFNDLSLEDAADRYFNPELVTQLSQSFASPGLYIARLIGATAALALSGVVAMSISDESQPVEVAKTEIAREVSAVEGAAGLDEIQVGTDGLLGSLRAGRMDELRTKYGRAARSRVGLTLEPPRGVDGAGNGGVAARSRNRRPVRP